VVSAFTEELGFPFNFEVNLDSEVLLDAAVEQLLQKLIPKPTSKLRRLSKVLP
jgi:hypothetical protein